VLGVSDAQPLECGVSDADQRSAGDLVLEECVAIESVVLFAVTLQPLHHIGVVPEEHRFGTTTVAATHLTVGPIGDLCRRRTRVVHIAIGHVFRHHHYSDGCLGIRSNVWSVSLFRIQSALRCPVVAEVTVEPISWSTRYRS